MPISDFFPLQPNWQDENPIRTQALHKDLCEFIYKTLGVIEYEDNGFRIITKFLMLSDNELRSFANKFSTIDKTPLSLWRILSWCIHPPVTRTRNSDEQITSIMTQASINNRLITWYHTHLVNNNPPGSPPPAEPSLIDSFYKFLNKICDLASIIIKKTVKAKILLENTEKWITKINDLKVTQS